MHFLEGDEDGEKRPGGGRRGGTCQKKTLYSSGAVWEHEVGHWVGNDGYMHEKKDNKIDGTEHDNRRPGSK